MTAAHTAGVVPVLTGPQRLMVAREHADLNQAELAQRLGVSSATVQRAESGKTEPRRTTLMAWSLATGVNLHWLETGQAPRQDDPDGGESAPSRARTDDLRIKSPTIVALARWRPPRENDHADRTVAA